MSKGEELYVRKSTSDRLSDPEDQMWDDTCISAAYDKAVSKANAEIAKQIAMETNSKHQGSSKSSDKKPKEKKPSKTRVWKEGMACRAVYEADGLEYEAVITAMFDGECIVRFWGYDNSEMVRVDSLKPTRGDLARYRQIEDASPDKLDDGFESQSNGESYDVSEHVAAASHSKKASKKKSKGKIPPAPTSEFPAMPNMPSFSRLNAAMRLPSTLSSFRVPHVAIPPPPPALLNEAEDEALSAMLISWYMSGYHTGLYQGMKRAKEGRRQ